MSNGTGPVVVGVGGSVQATEAAVRYAAGQALLLGTGVKLVHVVSSYVPMAPMLPMPPDDLMATGRSVAERFAQEARKYLPGSRVATEVLRGPLGAQLEAAARNAPLLVLGREQHPLMDRVLTGTTVSAVAAHAEVPVIVVPTDWSLQEERRCVVAGVKSLELAAPVVRRAFELAARGGDRVLLVHAWELQGQYDDLIASRVDLQEWATRSGHAIEEAVAHIRNTWPDVPVEIRVVHGQPARVLRDASREGDLLLLAKRPHAFPAGHLGATGRTLLRESLCPVEVIPPGSTQPPVADSELDRDGVLHG